MAVFRDSHPLFHSGALVVWGDDVHCFWGPFQRTAERPSGPAIYAPDFFLEEKTPWFVFEHYEKYGRDGLKTLFSVEESQAPKIHWQAPDFSDFEAQFAKIHQWIREGALKKCVPFVFTKGKSLASASAIASHGVKWALKGNAHGLFGLWTNQDWILGRTPEVLLEQRQLKSWSTMALAGTTTWKSYEEDPTLFLEDPKENREQGLVVDFLEEVLRPLGSVSKDKKNAFRSGNLAHLQTVIRHQGSQALSLEAMVACLHPTPALGCYPKDTWKIRMGNLTCEGWRGRFGAPFGISLSSSLAKIDVAIRNIQKREGRYYLGTGCGVVAESELKKEWNELAIKRASTLEALGL